MEKIDLIVPKDIRYVSDWEDYRLEDYNFPHILNKELTGCGYTEFCIKNGQNLILVSPRKFLLQNKLDQHPGSVYYVTNDLELSADYELDVSKDDTRKINENKKKSDASEKTTLDNLSILKENLRNYIKNCKGPKKILVTYDSFRHVKEVLGDGIRDYQVVVDEFQSIFMDSRFKSDTELGFLTYLNGQERPGGYKIQRVCYVSATPMLDKYLEMLDEFKDLPYYRLDWATENPGRVRKPKLEVKFSYQPLNRESKQIIQRYKNGNYEEMINRDTNEIIESREAVLFMNSVEGICQAIRSNDLLPEECNIICADTTGNRKSVRGAFNTVYARLDKDKPVKRKIPNSVNPIGEIPLKGEPHKMFTFCTRTVYLGADFYSTNARTFIFSDSNVDCLSVDISMDLEQILGRQRLDENPWKNSATLIIKTTKEKKMMAQEHFDNILKKKIKTSNNLIGSYNKADTLDEKEALALTYQDAIKASHYKNNYVAVNRYFDENGDEYFKPVFNNLMYVSEVRAFEVQQKDYKDRFTVFSALDGDNFDFGDNQDVKDAYEGFESLKDSTKRLKLLVNFWESQDRSDPEKTKESDRAFSHLLELLPTKYRNYYELLGIDRIKANKYREKDIKAEQRKLVSNGKVTEELTERLYRDFQPGKYSKEYIKSTLKKIYEEVGYSSTAKASDLDLYFYIKSTKTKDPNGKWVNGFEIIAKR